MARLDEGKALATILYLADKASGQIDLYKVVKMAYFADKLHLHEWGRTITADVYCRMPHGVTPSGLYEMIKSVRGDGEWSTDLSGYFDVVKYKPTDDVEQLVVAKKKPDLDELSDSDIEVLDKIYEENRDLNFDELKAKAHDKVYNADHSHWIDDEELAEGNFTLIEQIRYNQECDRFAKAW